MSIKNGKEINLLQANKCRVTRNKRNFRLSFLNSIILGENAKQVNDYRKSIKQSNQNRLALFIFSIIYYISEVRSFILTIPNSWCLYFLWKVFVKYSLLLFCISLRPLYSWNVRIFCQIFQTWSLNTFNAYFR